GLATQIGAGRRGLRFDRAGPVVGAEPLWTRGAAPAAVTFVAAEVDAGVPANGHVWVSRLRAPRLAKQPDAPTRDHPPPRASVLEIDLEVGAGAVTVNLTWRTGRDPVLARPTLRCWIIAAPAMLGVGIEVNRAQVPAEVARVTAAIGTLHPLLAHL